METRPEIERDCVDATKPIDIGSRLEPLIDDYLIDSLENVKQMLHEPIRREVSIVSDSPWEGNVTGYHVVFKDGDLYRMYYRGWNHDVKSGQFSREYTCYAQSKDGIHWTKPELGIYEFQGSKKEQYRLGGARWYTCFCAVQGYQSGLQARTANTRRWGQLWEHPKNRVGWERFSRPTGSIGHRCKRSPVITKGAFDSLNLAFWDATRQRYVEFHRDLRDGLRDVLTSTSTDFVHWTVPVWLECPGVARGTALYQRRYSLHAGAAYFSGFPDAVRRFEIFANDGGYSKGYRFQRHQAQRFGTYRRRLHD